MGRVVSCGGREGRPQGVGSEVVGWVCPVVFVACRWRGEFIGSSWVPRGSEGGLEVL